MITFLTSLRGNYKKKLLRFSLQIYKDIKNSQANIKKSDSVFFFFIYEAIIQIFITMYFLQIYEATFNK